MDENSEKSVDYDGNAAVWEYYPGGAKGASIERLARHLHFTMERIDPSESENFDALTEREREFYRACVREILFELPREKELVRGLIR